MIKYIFFLLFPVTIHAQLFNGQTLTKFPHVVPTRSTFMSANLFGLAKDGSIYNVSFVNHYLNNDPNKPTEPEVARIDLTHQTTTYQTMTGAVSSPGALWNSCMDSLGNIYTPFNRQLWIWKFKDSLLAINLGNPFKDGSSLVYSMALQNNGNMILGAANNSTGWSEYNPYTGQLIKHNEVDPQQQYVLSCAGEEDWAYFQVGQTGSNKLYAVRKSDDSTVLLFSCPTYTRFDLRVMRQGVYVGFTAGTGAGAYYLHNGTATKWNNGVANYTAYAECNDHVPPHPQVTIGFEPAFSNLTFNVNNGQPGSVPVKSQMITDGIAGLTGIFGMTGYANHVFIVSNYYGTYYDYDEVKDTMVTLGTTGVNIHSNLNINDSIEAFGNYPNGALLLFNRKRAWTVNIVKNGAVQPLSTTTNPQLVSLARSTPAQIHTITNMALDDSGNIVIAGMVQRTSNGCGIATWYKSTNTTQGIDAQRTDKILTTGLVKWKGLMIMATNNYYGGHPQLFYYSSYTNQIVDSADFGFTDYGNVFVKGDTLIGVVKSHIYKMNLNSKQLISDQTITTYYGSYQMEHNYIGLYNYTTPYQNQQFIQVAYMIANAANDCLYLPGGVGTGISKMCNVYPKVSAVQAKTLVVYPNPATSFIHVPYGSYVINNLITGEKVFKKNTTLINVSGLPNGTWMVRNLITGERAKIIIYR
jgi:hypothetical protein